MIPVAGVLLAAGASTRFGPSDKLLAPLAGRPLLRAALEPALRAGLAEVIVVTSTAAQVEALAGAAVTVVHNPDPARGLASSLALALGLAGDEGHDAVVVGLGDQPGLSVGAWRVVASAPGGPIVVATYAGRRGHPVRLDRRVWSLLPTVGDQGAGAVMRVRPDLVTEIACQGDPADIDSDEDLRRWN